MFARLQTRLNLLSSSLPASPGAAKQPARIHNRQLYTETDPQYREKLSRRELDRVPDAIRRILRCGYRE